MNFSEMNLDPSILKAIPYDTPTPVQARSIPEALNNKDLVVTAQTGTGKTASFIIPALQRLSQKQGNGKARVLILTPTRELATQVTTAARAYGKYLKFNIISLVGGMPYRQQLRDLAGNVDIIVATPGRLLDHMNSTDSRGKARLDLSNIEMLILDESDRMLDMGFIDDVKAIADATPSTRQTFLFSATIDPTLSNIIRQITTNPVRIEVAAEKMSPVKIKQELYMVDNPQHKNRLLKHFLETENIFKAIIFSGTKINADYLAKQLQDGGFDAAALHGDLKQSVRTRTIEQLRRGKIQFLVATDIAARGIDISDVMLVINYDVPKFCEDYVHRIGRTGRAGKSGTAITFALPTDMRHLQKIERYTSQRFEVKTVEGLEPTRKFSISDGGKSSSSDRNKRYGRGKSEGGSFGSKAPNRFASKDRGDFGDRRRDDKGSRPFARSADAPRGDARRDDRPSRPFSRSSEGSSSSFGDRKRDDRAPRPFSRSTDAPRGDARRDDRPSRPFSRSTEGSGSSFGDRKRDDRAPRPFARSTDAPRGDARRDDRPSRPFSRSSEGSGSSFGDRKRDDRAPRPFARSESGSSFADKKRSDDRGARPFVRSGESSFKKPGRPGEARKGYAERSLEKSSDYAKPSFKGKSVGGAKKPGFKSGAPARAGFKPAGKPSNKAAQSERDF